MANIIRANGETRGGEKQDRNDVLSGMNSHRGRKKEDWRGEVWWREKSDEGKRWGSEWGRDEWILVRTWEWAFVVATFREERRRKDGRGRGSGGKHRDFEVKEEKRGGERVEKRRRGGRDLIDALSWSGDLFQRVPSSAATPRPPAH